MRILKEKKGMTLIEVIISMAIFGVIAVVFLNVFSSALIWTFRAGDRGIAYTNAISDLENKISESEEHQDYLDLTFTDGSDSIDISIRGRKIESSNTEKQITSELDVFVPQMPRISIFPTFKNEGDLLTEVVIKGYDTNFNSTTKITLYDSSGTNIILDNINRVINNNAEITLNLPHNLLNNEYIINITSNILNEPDEIARTKYFVEQPKFLMIGESDVYVSADGSTWLKRSDKMAWINPDASDAIFNHYDGINSMSISSDGRSYIISQPSNLLVSNRNDIWLSTNQSGINDTNWVNQYFKYYAASDSGILASSNRFDWLQQYMTSKPMKAITNGYKNDLTQVILAVGDEGSYAFYDGSYWRESNITSSDVDFKSVSVSDTGEIAALGTIDVLDNPKSVIWTSQIPNDGTDLVWNQSYFGNQLNDLHYSTRLGEFIAVGENGRIIISNSSSSWLDLVMTSLEGINLNGVFSNSSDVIIVGDDGNIVINKDNTGWQMLDSTGITEDLFDVSGR